MANQSLQSAPLEAPRETPKKSQTLNLFDCVVLEQLANIRLIHIIYVDFVLVLLYICTATKEDNP